MANLPREEALRDKFARILAHDLNNPLSVIDGALQFIKSEGDGAFSERQRKNFKLAQQSVIDLQRMVMNLVDVANITPTSAFPQKDFSLEEVIEESIGEFQEVAALENKEFLFEKETTLPLLSASPNLMRRVIVNLLSNALRDAESNTVIRVEMHYRKKEDLFHVSVQNESGAPIPAELLDRVFDKWIQAKSDEIKVGRALGLTLCKMIIELHGGRIWAESSPEKDNLFAFLIPRMRTPSGNSQG